MKKYSGSTPLLCLVVFCCVTTVYGQGTVTANASAPLAGKDSQPLATFGAVYPVAETADAYILETCAHVAVNDCRRRVYDGLSFHMDGGRAERYRAAYVDCEHDVALFAVDKREFDGPLQTFKFARKPPRKGDVLTYRSLFTGKTVTGRMVDVDGCAIVVKFEQDGRRGLSGTLVFDRDGHAVGIFQAFSTLDPRVGYVLPINERDVQKIVDYIGEGRAKFGNFQAVGADGRVRADEALAAN